MILTVMEAATLTGGLSDLKKSHEVLSIFFPFLLFLLCNRGSVSVIKKYCIHFHLPCCSGGTVVFALSCWVIRV